MRSADLIETAKKLTASRRKPKQADLCRAVSTLYYALFHELAGACADHLIGTKGADRSGSAWRQAYRALDHFHLKNQCDRKYFKNSVKFPQEIKDFAADIIEMQQKRHSADYDPIFSTTKEKVERDTQLVENSITTYKNVPVKDRKAFSVYVLLKSRGESHPKT